MSSSLKETQTIPSELMIFVIEMTVMNNITKTVQNNLIPLKEITAIIYSFTH